jgi:small subunit ribosomal protein S17
MIQFIGRVVGTKMMKTARVCVNRLTLHPVIKKYYNKKKTFFAHDELEECRVGDVVRIEECRKLSKKKYFRLMEIVERVDGTESGQPRKMART